MTSPKLLSDDLLEQWFPETDATLQYLRRQVQTVQVPAGEVLFRRGDVCRNYMVVLSGTVRVQVQSTGGREVSLYRVTDGQSCVITTACLISHEHYPAEGIAERQTAAVLVSHGLFHEALVSSADFRRFVFGAQGRKLSELIQRIEDVAFGRVDVKLARLLIDRCDNRPGSISATHQHLARELGSAREVVSRHLKAFEKNGWLTVRRGRLEILRPEALQVLCRDGS
jgi:CRP/FNR family transcriptional regulator